MAGRLVTAVACRRRSAECRHETCRVLRLERGPQLRRVGVRESLFQPAKVDLAGTTGLFGAGKLLKDFFEFVKFERRQIPPVGNACAADKFESAPHVGHEGAVARPVISVHTSRVAIVFAAFPAA
jgi:hypothetical protein